MFSFYLLAWQRALDFSGRSSRPECWWFMLFHLLVTLTCILLDVRLAEIGWLDLSYGVASTLPLISLIIRRLHDTGRSGWWGWVFFAPLVGPLVLVYLLAMQGTGAISAEEVAP